MESPYQPKKLPQKKSHNLYEPGNLSELTKKQIEAIEKSNEHPNIKAMMIGKLLSRN